MYNRNEYDEIFGISKIYKRVMQSFQISYMSTFQGVTINFFQLNKWIHTKWIHMNERQNYNTFTGTKDKEIVFSLRMCASVCL